MRIYVDINARVSSKPRGWGDTIGEEASITRNLPENYLFGLGTYLWLEWDTVDVRMYSSFNASILQIRFKAVRTNKNQLTPKECHFNVKLN